MSVPPTAEDLFAGAPAATLATYRRDGSVLLSPVWVQWHAGAFEVVIADGDIKRRHLERNPRCGLVVFETSFPFRGTEVEGEAVFDASNVDAVRRMIAARYIGREAAEAFARDRAKVPSAVLRLVPTKRREWDLRPLLERRADW
jgi:PPOX class probable F420-dependent enzyme